MKYSKMKIILILTYLSIETLSTHLMEEVKAKQKSLIKKITATPIEKAVSIGGLVSKNETHSTKNYGILKKYGQKNRSPKLLKKHLIKDVTLASNSISKQDGVLNESLGINSLQKTGDIFQNMGDKSKKKKSVFSNVILFIINNYFWV